MGQVLLFRRRTELHEEPVDLLTAADVAIRDLREIAANCLDTVSREQAEECRRMLERAYKAALRGVECGS
jgi:hypothetical protein